jgi:hypothetical protein
MKKPTKTTLRRKLDKICSEIVRGRGRCEWCRSKESLQCCHIFSRVYNNTRWDLDNLICLCATHHFYFHRNPVLFGEWVIGFLGLDKYNLLKEKHNQITKYTTEDLILKYKILQDLAEKKEGADKWIR